MKNYLFRSTSKAALLILTVLQMLLITFRDENYNSDTSNYNNYVNTFADYGLFDSFILTKLEPLHLLLMSFSVDLHDWLLFEFIASSIFLIFIYKRVNFTFTICIILALTMPLYSSSIRFANGLLLISVFMVYFGNGLIRFTLLTTSGLMAHPVAGLSGVISSAKFPIIFISALISYFFILLNPQYYQRLVFDSDMEIGFPGLRFYIAIIFILYFMRFIVKIKEFPYFYYILLSSTILMFSLYSFSTLNRVMALIIITLCVEFDKILLSYPLKWKFDNILSVLMYLYLILPHFLFLIIRGYD
jgi:hypothetical protein